MALAGQHTGAGMGAGHPAWPWSPSRTGAVAWPCPLLASLGTAAWCCGPKVWRWHFPGPWLRSSLCSITGMTGKGGSTYSEQGNAGPSVAEAGPPNCSVCHTHGFGVWSCLRRWQLKEAVGTCGGTVWHGVTQPRDEQGGRRSGREMMGVN